VLVLLVLMLVLLVRGKRGVPGLLHLQLLARELGIESAARVVLGLDDVGAEGPCGSSRVAINGRRADLRIRRCTSAANRRARHDIDIDMGRPTLRRDRDSASWRYRYLWVPVPGWATSQIRTSTAAPTIVDSWGVAAVRRWASCLCAYRVPGCHESTVARLAGLKEVCYDVSPRRLPGRRRLSWLVMGVQASTFGLREDQFAVGRAGRNVRTKGPRWPWLC
jgi:hypothetical protein